MNGKKKRREYAQLRPVGVGPRVGHGQDPGARVLEVRVYLASASTQSVSQPVTRRRRRRMKEEEGGEVR